MRRKIAEKYLEVAKLADAEGTDTSGQMHTVIIGVAVLAGIAAGDAICIARTGSRYAGTDHMEAAGLLTRTDAELGGKLRDLVRFKPPAHYGSTFLGADDRTKALRLATALVAAARAETPA